MASVAYAFRVAPSTVSNIVLETCSAIWDSLSEVVLLKPTENSWLQIAKDFEERWQLPNCVGSMDGKHVTIQAPPKSGSTFYNYKGAHSIVLLALCDANYKFTLVDIGAESRHSDGGILKNSNTGKLLHTNSINLPAPSLLGNTGEKMNYYIAADEAFPLSNYIMRPYPGRFLSQIKRIFNYRLCRGRRVIENVFGILASRWRIFRKPIIAYVPTVLAIVKASVCLHNFLMDSEKRYFQISNVDYENDKGDLIEGDWRRNEDINHLAPVKRTGSNMYGRNSELIREQLATYFMNEGAVDFHYK